MSDKPDWVAAARARCEAATPGPWTLRDVDTVVAPGRGLVSRDSAVVEDSAFIAAARTALPRALAVVEAADALAAAYDAMTQGHHATCRYAARGGSVCPTGECGCHFEAIDAALAAYREAREG